MGLLWSVALTKANMKSVCCWLFTLSCMVFGCMSTPCFLPEIYGIGVLHIGPRSNFPRMAVRWCDDVMLCGRAPLSLRIITKTTTQGKVMKVIKSYTDIQMWILTASKFHNSTTTHLIRQYLQSRQKRFLYFSNRSEPETDAEWCSLVLKFKYNVTQQYVPHFSSLQRDYVLSILHKINLKTLLIMYDSTTEWEVMRLTEDLTDMYVLYTLHQNESNDWHDHKDMGPRYRNIDFEDYTNILIWCDYMCIVGFLNEILKEVEDLEHKIACSHMTQILIVNTPVKPNSSYITNGLSDIASNDQSVTTATVRKTKNPTEDLDGILNLVQHFFHVAVLSDTDGCTSLQTLVMTNGHRHFTYAGFGDNLGHMINRSEVFPNTKWRFNREKFIIGTAIWEPFVMITEKNGKREYSGLCIDMLKALASSLNFTYELRTPEDGQFGSLVNGSWTGLIEMLRTKEAQMVVAPLAIDARRATVVDFTTPFYLDYTGVLFKRPDPSAHKWKTYIMPFKWEVFVCITVSFVAATAFGHIVCIMSANVIFGNRQADSDVMDTLQYFYGSLLAQGGVWNPTTASARAFVSAWWLFCVVVAAIYSGNLTASFAVSRYDPSFTTLQEMLDGGSYEYGTVPGTVWFDIFEFSNRSDFKEIERKILTFTREHSGEDLDEVEYHVQRTHQGNYAYIGNVASLSRTVNQDCDLMLLGETFLPLQYAIALQKGSPLTETVSRWVLQMNEGGLDQLWASYWWKAQDAVCDTSQRTSTKIVTLEDSQTSFYILVVGFTIALFAIIFENLVSWLYRKRKRREWNEHSTSSVREQHDISESSSVIIPKAVFRNGVSTITLPDRDGNVTPVLNLNGIHRNITD